jgi:hypothetical protein
MIDERPARQRLLARLPALSYRFGLVPADLDHMTGWEVDTYEQALDDIERAEKAERDKLNGGG